MIYAVPYILLAMVFYGFGEYYAKIYANTDNFRFAFVAWVGYSLNALLFFPAIKAYNSLSILGTIWNLSYVIITICIGIFIFGEHLTNIQLLGIFFGIMSIVFLSV